MDTAGTIGADGWEEIPCIQANECIFSFATIASEEDCACAGTKSYAENITLSQWGTERGRGEGVIMRLVSIGMIGHRITIHAG